MSYPLLKIGSENSSVTVLKQLLNKNFSKDKQYIPLSESKVFGAETERAVKNFQNLKQLKADGIVGDLTWERLYETEAKPKKSKKLSERAMQIMMTQLKVREATGKNDGPEVEKFLKSVNLGKGYPWCMAIVYWAYQTAADELSVKNPLLKTGGVLKQWNESKAENRKKTPEPFDIFIMDFGKGTGHAGIVTKVLNGKVFTVEGNTSAEPTNSGADREGNGVFERSRNTNSFKGFLRQE